MSEQKKLFINLKTQDKLREWFSKRGSVDNIVFDNLSLGDSDINYELSTQLNKIATLPTPYQIPQIKHKLIYEGNYNGLTGKIATYLRKIDLFGKVYSQYNSFENFIEGQIVPTVKEAYNVDKITLSSTFDAYVVFFETLPDGYIDEKNNPLRLKEKYDYSFVNLPLSYDIQIGINDEVGNPSSFINTTLKASDLIKEDGMVAIESLTNNKLNGLYKTYNVSSIDNSFSLKDMYNQPINLSDYEIAKLHLYQVTVDEENCSLIIAKGNVTYNNKINGLIKVRGKVSGIEKTIYFNY